jgi:hypothetical protein
MMIRKIPIVNFLLKLTRSDAKNHSHWNYWFPDAISKFHLDLLF